MRSREFRQLNKMLCDLRRIKSRVIGVHRTTSLREWRQVRRQLLLDMLVPDRRCPGCGLTITRSRAWVIRYNQALCRSCVMRCGKGKWWKQNVK